MSQGPPATDGERMIWAAAYAAAWTQLREFNREHGLESEHSASVAADEAWGALNELRELANGDGDFAADARAVLAGGAA